MAFIAVKMIFEGSQGKGPLRGPSTPSQMPVPAFASFLQPRLYSRTGMLEDVSPASCVCPPTMGAEPLPDPPAVPPPSARGFWVGITRFGLGRVGWRSP